MRFAVQKLGNGCKFIKGTLDKTIKTENPVTVGQK